MHRSSRRPVYAHPSSSFPPGSSHAGEIPASGEAARPGVGDRTRRARAADRWYRTRASGRPARHGRGRPGPAMARCRRVRRSGTTSAGSPARASSAGWRTASSGPAVPPRRSHPARRPPPGRNCRPRDGSAGSDGRRSRAPRRGRGPASGCRSPSSRRPAAPGAAAPSDSSQPEDRHRAGGQLRGVAASGKVVGALAGHLDRGEGWRHLRDRPPERLQRRVELSRVRSGTVRRSTTSPSASSVVVRAPSVSSA